MHRADADDHADVGLGDRAPARRSGRRPASPSRAPAPRSPRARSRISSGSPISVLKFAREATVRRWGASTRQQQVLGRGLAGRAGDADHLGARARAARRWRGAGALSAGRRRRAARRARAQLDGLARARASSARPRRRRRAPAARTRRRRRARPGRPTNSAPGPASRESITTLGPGGVRRRRHEPGARGLAMRRRSRSSCSGAGLGLRCMPQAIWHPASAALRRPRGASPRHRRRRRTGSCGRPRTPGPARGPCRRSRPRRRPRRPAIASPIAARRSARARHPARLPARISSMIASGSSERGLSEVTITRSASRLAISPISGRLPRSRSPPQPNTTWRRPSVRSRGGSEHVLERVGRVGVVDQHREVLALVDRLEAAGHLAGRARSRSPRVCSETPTRARGGERAEHVVDVEAAAQRRASAPPRPSGERSVKREPPSPVSTSTAR